MLFTITKEQYQKYKDTANECRQYILNRFSTLCETVDKFNRYFSSENIDIYGNGFQQKSLLLTLLEGYEEDFKINPKSLEEYLDEELSDDRIGLFENLAIYVHWDSVTVTNERNQSVVVTDLYAKVPIYPDATLIGRFSLTRATYSYEQYSSNYMHSHVNGINNSDPSSFMRPCLGSGPLNSTQNSLSYSGNSDLWDLFCVELDRYVHIESIAGIPYRYLSDIGTNQLSPSPLIYEGNRSSHLRTINENADRSELFRLFFKWVLEKKQMKFSFCNGLYKSAYSDTEWILKLSEAFLKFFAMMSASGRTNVNSNELLNRQILIEVKKRDGVLYYYSASSTNHHLTNYGSFQNLHVLYFKGNDIRTHVDSPARAGNGSDNTFYVLNPILALTFLDQCLNYLNIYEHEKNKEVIQDNQEESEIISGADDSSTGSTGSAGKNAFRNYTTGEERISVSL